MLKIIFILLLLTSCNSSLVQLEKLNLQGNNFRQALAREYLAFAKTEAAQYDWVSSGIFSRKGVDIAKGKNPEPEKLKFWNIPNESINTLTQARKYLIDTLTPNIKSTNPNKAARAQFLFDCWVEQEEENWQDTHIHYCREHFYKTMDELYSTIAINKEQQIQQAEKLAAEKLAQQQIIAQQQKQTALKQKSCTTNCLKTREKRTVYFATESYTPNKRTRQVIKKLAKKIKNKKHYKITLNGYADSVGDEEHNMQLSKKRAQAIKRLLTNNWIDEKAITILAFGEKAAIITTADNTNEQENRAVEIIIEM